MSPEMEALLGKGHFKSHKSKLGVAQSFHTGKTVGFIIIYYLRPSALEDLLRMHL